MTCQHEENDPSCGEYDGRVAEARRLVEEHDRRVGATATPDAENYDILDSDTVGPHLVLKVRYPNCAKCSYEGAKVMVFLNCSLKDALKWRRIDPHFRGEQGLKLREAPSPAARFPASEKGWADAVAYAGMREVMDSK